MTDQEQDLEHEINDTRRRMVRYQERGNLKAAHNCFHRLQRLQEQRSFERIQEMERERGLRQ